MQNGGLQLFHQNAYTKYIYLFVPLKNYIMHQSPVFYQLLHPKLHQIYLCQNVILTCCQYHSLSNLIVLNQICVRLLHQTTVASNAIAQWSIAFAINTLYCRRDIVIIWLHQRYASHVCVKLLYRPAANTVVHQITYCWTKLASDYSIK